MFTATWWGVGLNYGTLNIQGDSTRYVVEWGDGSKETIRTDQDDDGDDYATTDFGHGYTSDGTYDVSVRQHQSGLPPIRLKAFMYGRETDDIVIGGSQLDDIIYAGSGNDLLSGARGRDTINGGEGNDTIRGNEGDDFLLGGDGNDAIRGDRGSDLIGGQDGDDRIAGGDDADYIYGEAGADGLFGDAGDDYLYGELGADRLTGGKGADVFGFAPVNGQAQDPDADTITDFTRGQDYISVGDWAGEPFTFIGAEAFGAGGAPELRADVRGSLTVVTGDADGDGAADFTIRVAGAPTLDASDFFL